MPTRIRLPSPAMVVALVSLFVALSSTAVAAVQLKRNAVLSKHIKNGQVKRADLRNGAVDSRKVGNGTLAAEDFAPGVLPDLKPGPAGPRGADGERGPQGPPGEPGEPGDDATVNGVPAGGDLAGTYPNPTIRKSEAMQYVADADISNGFSNLGGGWAPVSFYKDREGVVHLRGLLGTPASGTSSAYLFSLPAGYRPCGGFNGVLLFPSQSGTGAARIDIHPNGGGVFAHNYTNNSHLTLNGITFPTENC